MTWTTLAMAKKQIGIVGTDCTDDDWLRAKLAQAEAIVFQYLQGEPTTVTPLVQAAIYLQFAELWRFRGDDTDGEVPKGVIPGDPSMQVQRCLYSLRVPSLA